MLSKEVMMDNEPCAVELNRLPEGGAMVRLHRNSVQVEQEGETKWKTDEVAFKLPADRTDTAEEIALAFDGWWDFGTGWTPADELPRPLEERVSELEEAVALALGM